MNNPFHELEQMMEKHSFEEKELSRALMLAAILVCCDDCGSRLRSDEFREGFRKLAEDLKICRQLKSRYAA